MSDKSGLLELAGALAESGVEIVSTGSTAQTIRDAGHAVTDVSSVTGFPESLDGRVKTLHPSVHAGLLADLRLESHEQQLGELGIEPFQLVVVNLYPFVETVASGADTATVVENVDIGGPAMVRASAKNHPNVAIVVSPGSYAEVVEPSVPRDHARAPEAARRRGLRPHRRLRHRGGVVLRERRGGDLGRADIETPGTFDERLAVDADRSTTLRYGENAHQSAALYTTAGGTGIAQATQLHGKEMSYNNYVDADAAVRAAYDFDEPAVAIISTPTRAASRSPRRTPSTPSPPRTAAAHACDPLSAFGGVIAANRPVTAGMAETVKDIFTEVVVAPAFAPEAIEILSRKKNIRLLTLPADFALAPREVKQISGGFLVQDADRFTGFDQSTWDLVAGEPADDQTLADLAFAWKASRAVKSNAILLANQVPASGRHGAGQPGRLVPPRGDPCRRACRGQRGRLRRVLPVRGRPPGAPRRGRPCRGAAGRQRP